MSKRSLKEDNSAVGRLAGYYGKIPLAGDFITRRVTQETVSIWDNWLRHGLLYVKNAEPARGWIDQMQSTIWNFVIPPALRVKSSASESSHRGGTINAVGGMNVRCQSKCHP